MRYRSFLFVFLLPVSLISRVTADDGFGWDASLVMEGDICGGMVLEGSLGLSMTDLEFRIGAETDFPAGTDGDASVRLVQGGVRSPWCTAGLCSAAGWQSLALGGGMSALADLLSDRGAGRCLVWGEGNDWGASLRLPGEEGTGVQASWLALDRYGKVWDLWWAEAAWQDRSWWIRGAWGLGRSREGILCFRDRDDWFPDCAGWSWGQVEMLQAGAGWREGGGYLGVAAQASLVPDLSAGVDLCAGAGWQARAGKGGGPLTGWKQTLRVCSREYRELDGDVPDLAWTFRSEAGFAAENLGTLDLRMDLSPGKGEAAEAGGVLPRAGTCRAVLGLEGEGTRTGFSLEGTWDSPEGSAGAEAGILQAWMPEGEGPGVECRGDVRVGREKDGAFSWMTRGSLEPSFGIEGGRIVLSLEAGVEDAGYGPDVFGTLECRGTLSPGNDVAVLQAEWKAGGSCRIPLGETGGGWWEIRVSLGVRARSRPGDPSPPQE